MYHFVLLVQLPKLKYCNLVENSTLHFTTNSYNRGSLKPLKWRPKETKHKRHQILLPGGGSWRRGKGKMVKPFFPLRVFFSWRWPFFGTMFKDGPSLFIYLKVFIIICAFVSAWGKYLLCWQGQAKQRKAVLV
jgi:hypothetical protein